MEYKPPTYVLLFFAFSVIFLFIFVKIYGVREYSDYCKNSQIKNIKNSTNFQISTNSLFLVVPNCDSFEFTAYNPFPESYTVIWSESRIIINNIPYYAFVDAPNVSRGWPSDISSSFNCSQSGVCGVNERVRRDFSQPLIVETNETRSISISRFFPIIFSRPSRYDGRIQITTGGTFSLIDNAVTTLSIVYIYKDKKYKNNYSYMLVPKSS